MQKHKSINRKLHKEGQEILSEIETIKEQLALARKNFDFATDSTLIDSYTFEVIALTKKYEYFLQLAKQNGLIASGFQKIS